MFFYSCNVFFYLKKHECFKMPLCQHQCQDIDYTEQTINWSHSESESDAE